VKRAIGLLVVAGLAIAAAAAWTVLASRSNPPANETMPPARAVAPPSIVPDAAIAGAPPPDAGERLDTPEHAVDAAVRAFASGDADAFRGTLLPRVRNEVTADVFARCQQWIGTRRVLPDWEMAETAREDGHDVRRVSMFGKSMTGFHAIDGRWLADRVWCLPTGVP
jgi:hypothetical protein